MAEGSSFCGLIFSVISCILSPCLEPLFGLADQDHMLEGISPSTAYLAWMDPVEAYYDKRHEYGTKHLDVHLVPHQKRVIFH